MYICNARCSDRQDISDSDDIPQRQVLDFTINSHGLQLLNFLKPLDICMLNGRGKDNYTPRGCSVVDYCLVPKEEYATLK